MILTKKLYENKIGAGQDGFVIKYGAAAIKVYNPKNKKLSFLEFDNLLDLRKNGYNTPEPYDIIDIKIPKKIAKHEFNIDQDIITKCLVKDFIDGKPLGKDKLNYDQVGDLVRQLNQYKEDKYLFLDYGTVNNYIVTPNKIFFIDCSKIYNEKSLPISTL